MTTAEKTPKAAKHREAAARPAEIVREYGPFPGADKVAGVSHDGQRVWFAGGDRLIAFDPQSGQVERTLPRAGDAGTAFDGKHLWQIAETRIDKIDPASGDVVASIPAPGSGSDSASPGRTEASGLASTAVARSTASTRRPAPCCARSNRTDS
jgi:hypothetical protein